MKTINLTIATPEKLFFNGEVKKLNIMSIDGDMGILPGHLPMVVAVETAPIEIEVNGEIKSAALAGGFALIKNYEINILVDAAEWSEDIEISRAAEAKKRAEERIRANKSDLEYIRSQVALKRSLARLNAVKSKRASY